MFLFLSNRFVVIVQHCVNQLRRTDTIGCYYLRLLLNGMSEGWSSSKKTDNEGSSGF